MTDTETLTKPPLTKEAIDSKITFHEDDQILEVDLSDVSIGSSKEANLLYDRLEELIAATGEPLWFFLIDYRDTRVDPIAWAAWAVRGKALNMAHAMASVRYDSSPETKAQIERASGTEAFDPNLFADRDAAIERLRSLPSTRIARIVHEPTLIRGAYRERVRLDDESDIAEFDFSKLIFNHSLDVNDCYNELEELLGETGRKWYFLINYEGCQIMPKAWVDYARRGKRINETYSLGSVRYAPGSETERDIRMRAETGGFRPNIRNTREEAMRRIDELKRGET